jgi:glycosyltransferase involved in cell wall biosynthesis
MPAARKYVSTWHDDERRGLLLLGNLSHPEFLTLLRRCFAYVRTPVCDGVASSVLESLASGIPVIASDNGARPPQVTTFRDDDASALQVKLQLVTEQYEQIKARTQLKGATDNIERTVDWLLRETSRHPSELQIGAVHVR